jgi:stalled ribosome alternative rescue factor ArfA
MIEQDNEKLKQDVQKLKEDTDPFVLAPRILDIAFRSRVDKTSYNSGSYTRACDVVLEFEWQGRRYRIPAFEV